MTDQDPDPSFERWRNADRLIREAGVPYDVRTRANQHQLVRLVARACMELGGTEEIVKTFGLPNTQFAVKPQN